MMIFLVNPVQDGHREHFKVDVSNALSTSQRARVAATV